MIHKAIKNTLVLQFKHLFTVFFNYFIKKNTLQWFIYIDYYRKSWVEIDFLMTTTKVIKKQTKKTNYSVMLEG